MTHVGTICIFLDFFGSVVLSQLRLTYVSMFLNVTVKRVMDARQFTVYDTKNKIPKCRLKKFFHT